MAELADAHALGACTARCAGSTPVLGTSVMTGERNTFYTQPSPQEILVRIEDSFDETLSTMETKIQEVEGWKNQVQPGTNERRDQALRHWHETMKLVTELRRQIRSIFQSSKHPSEKTHED